jgi:hypothetical protein
MDVCGLPWSPLAGEESRLVEWCLEEEAIIIGESLDEGGAMLLR